MEKILSEKESLDLINVMISSARNNLQKGTGKIFLLWGYVIAMLALANLAIFIALPPQINYYSFYVWFSTPLGLILYFNQLRKISVTLAVPWRYNWKALSRRLLPDILYRGTSKSRNRLKAKYLVRLA